MNNHYICFIFISWEHFLFLKLISMSAIAMRYLNLLEWKWSRQRNSLHLLNFYIRIVWTVSRTESFNKMQIFQVNRLRLDFLFHYLCLAFVFVHREENETYAWDLQPHVGVLVPIQSHCFYNCKILSRQSWAIQSLIDLFQFLYPRMFRLISRHF